MILFLYQIEGLSRRLLFKKIFLLQLSCMHFGNSNPKLTVYVGLRDISMFKKPLR